MHFLKCNGFYLSDLHPSILSKSSLLCCATFLFWLFVWYQTSLFKWKVCKNRLFFDVFSRFLVSFCLLLGDFFTIFGVIVAPSLGAALQRFFADFIFKKVGCVSAKIFTIFGRPVQT